MSEHIINLDDLSDHLTLTDDGADAEWPTDIEIRLDVKFHPPEPDVGLFTSSPEITSTTYVLGDEQFAREDDFVDALYLVIGEWCEEDADEIAELIANRIENEELEEGE